MKCEAHTIACDVEPDVAARCRAEATQAYSQCVRLRHCSARARPRMAGGTPADTQAFPFGCPKCRYARSGCDRCRADDYRPTRGCLVKRAAAQGRGGRTVAPINPTKPARRDASVAAEPPQHSVCGTRSRLSRSADVPASKPRAKGRQQVRASTPVDAEAADDAALVKEPSPAPQAASAGGDTQARQLRASKRAREPSPAPSAARKRRPAAAKADRPARPQSAPARKAAADAEVADAKAKPPAEPPKAPTAQPLSPVREEQPDQPVEPPAQPPKDEPAAEAAAELEAAPSGRPRRGRIPSQRMHRLPARARASPMRRTQGPRVANPRRTLGGLAATASPDGTGAISWMTTPSKGGTWPTCGATSTSEVRCVAPAVRGQNRSDTTDRSLCHPRHVCIWVVNSDPVQMMLCLAVCSSAMAPNYLDRYSESHCGPLCRAGAR